MENLDKIYKSRRDKVCSYLKENNIAAAVFEDSEERRDISIRYLTGHPSDAILILGADGFCTLTPWDINLAAQKAHADNVVPYTQFDRSNIKAVKAILKELGKSCGTKSSALALAPQTPHYLFEKYKAELTEWEIHCKENSVHDKVISLRAVKDEYEIACTRKSCSIADSMTAYISDNIRKGTIKNETDVALYIERELRAQGCERTSFDTLAAGPERSFAIHAFPGYTGGTWGSEGLSILDFGVCYEGYASDCTITIAKNPTSQQEELLDLVELAAKECLELYKPGKCILSASRKADEIFAAKNRNMPHGLGHGIGLEIHEAPFVSIRSTEDKIFEAGNIITLEPGLYDPKLGGTRLENDVLITKDGNEVLTHSKIFRI